MRAVHLLALGSWVATAVAGCGGGGGGGGASSGPFSRPPVAVDDAALTAHQIGIDIQVLANDSDPDGDALTVSSVTQPVTGTAAIAASARAVRYTPPVGFIGNSSFTYTISDGRGGSATAAVAVTVVAFPSSALIVTDQGGPGTPPRILVVDPATGMQTQVASGGSLCQPRSIEFVPPDALLIADASLCAGPPMTGADIFRVSFTGAQSSFLVPGSIQAPTSIRRGPGGDLFVADDRGGAAGRIFRVDPATGTATAIPEPVGGTVLADPQGLAIASNGDIYVVDVSIGAVVKIDPVTGAESIIAMAGSGGSNLMVPLGIALDASGKILVTDLGPNVGTLDGDGLLVRIDPTSGAETVVSPVGGSTNLLTDPYSIAVDARGAFIADEQAFGGGGGVIRIDLTTGAQTSAAQAGSFLNPQGVAIIP